MKRRRDSQPKLYQFRKCRLLRDGKIITDDLWVRDGKIVDPKPIFWEEQIQADVQIDCNNLIICPGFIDVQINGKCYINWRRIGSYRGEIPPQEREGGVCLHCQVPPSSHPLPTLNFFIRPCRSWVVVAC